MGSHWDQIKSYSGVTAIVSLYGIASLLVVFLGPSLGLGLTEQIIIIALLLLTWPCAILIAHYRRRRRERMESRDSAVGAVSTSASASTGKPNGRGPRVPSRVHDELTRSVEEVVLWLGNMRFGAVRHGDPAYSLPWFVVSGPPDSGKTSLLLSAGMDFHALPTQRRTDQNLIRPTRDVDWRVTDWCVLLDTTGRYQTEGPDGDEWSVLVEIIKKYRKRRPVDGLLVTANIGRLLASGEAEIEQQAKILRARLDELNVRVQARFPVYLVFTHSDSIEGFEEFFALSDPTARGQVWGTTIPLDQSGSAHARFDVEFDYLYDTLMRYRLLRLSTQDPSTEQLMVFDFPLRFGDARRKLGLFTSALFRPNPFSESPLLRGFYFTSSAPGNGSARPGPTTAEDVPEDVATAGEGYFSERLFDEVLRRDKDLAASFQAGQENPQRWRNVMLGAAAGLVLFVILGLILSFSNNAALISDASKLGRKVASYSINTDGKDLVKDRKPSPGQLQDVDRLRELLVKLEDHQNDWPPFYLNSLFYRFGLYAGKSASPYLRAIYFDAISHDFFRTTITEVEAGLQSVDSASPADSRETGGVASQRPAKTEGDNDRLGQYYDLLKAYLMISDNPERAEASFLITELRDYWRKSLQPEDEKLALNQLDFYAHEAMREDAPHMKASDEIVKLARARLESYPPEFSYYKRSISEISERLKEVTLDQILNDKRGLLEGSASVSGAFTVDGYSQMIRAIESAPERVSQEDWVGRNKTKGKAQTVDIHELKQTYARQYIDAWQKFLESIKVKQYTRPEDAASALKEFSKNDSPLVRVMAAVSRETSLSKKASSFWSRINPFSADRSEGGADSVADTIEKAFQPVAQFVSTDGQKGGDQFLTYLAILGSASPAVSDTTDQWPQSAKSLLASNDPKGIPQLEKQMKALLADMKGKSPAAGSLLEQPLTNIRVMATGENREQIQKEWSDKLFVHARQLEQGYPFATALSEASLSDLKKFLNPVDGELWVFVRQNVESSLDQTDGQWKSREGSRVKFSESFINYLNGARRLRDALFSPNSKEPGFEYGLTIQTTPEASLGIELQVEGRRVESGGASQSLKWPGSGGTRISILQGSGPAKQRPFEGSWWSLFRMFEQGGASATSDKQYALAWVVGSTTVRAKLQPPSTANNPFDLSMFRQLRAPQSTQ